MLHLTQSNWFQILLSVVMVILLAQQTYQGLQLNAKYMFTVDLDGTIVVMNTQTGLMTRCDREFNCDNGQTLKLTKP